MQGYLEQGESIVASCGPVYATERRLVHLGQRPERAARASGAGPIAVASLPYSSIQSVRAAVGVRPSTVLLGTLVVALSLLLVPPQPVLAAALLVGLLAVAAGLVSGVRRIEVRHSGNGGGTVTRWGLGDASGSSARAFVETVRLRMASPMPLRVPVFASGPGGTHGALGLEGLAWPGVPRSVLLAPADRPGEVREGLGWSPDAICLDLAGARSPEVARQVVWAELVAVAHSRSRAWVRVGAEAHGDLEASVWPGLEAVVAAVCSAADVRRLEAALASLSAERRLPSPPSLVPLLETDGALWSVEEIASASPAVRAVALGMGDLAGGHGELSESHGVAGGLRGVPVREYLWGRASFGAGRAGVALLGFLAAEGAGPEAGGDGGRADLLGDAAAAARRAGFQGAFTRGPSGVLACNSAFGQGQGLAASEPPGAPEDARGAGSGPAMGPGEDGSP